MEENNQNINQPQVQVPIQEQAPTPPSSPVSDKSRLKLPILIGGVVIFLIIIGTASAAFFLPKSNMNPPKETEVVISPQPTVAEATIIPSPSSNLTPAPTSSTPTANWKTFSSATFSLTYMYPSDWKNDNTCQGCSAEPMNESSDERYLHPAEVKYPNGITYSASAKANSSPLSYFINSLKTRNLTNKTSKELSVNGSSGYLVAGNDESGKKIALAVFENQSYIFQFTSSEAYITNLENLLSTVTFKPAN